MVLCANFSKDFKVTKAMIAFAKLVFIDVNVCL
jgi:hypothetical protein